jgi:hypothetical protein
MSHLILCAIKVQNYLITLKYIFYCHSGHKVLKCFVGLFYYATQEEKKDVAIF